LSPWLFPGSRELKLPAQVKSAALYCGPAGLILFPRKERQMKLSAEVSFQVAELQFCIKPSRFCYYNPFISYSLFLLNWLKIWNRFGFAIANVKKKVLLYSLHPHTNT